MPCNTVESFTVTTTAKMSNVTEPQLGAPTIALIEQITGDFVTKSVDGVAMEPVEIVAQQIAGGNDATRRLRKMQVRNDVDLLVTFAFQGISIKDTAAEVATEINTALNLPGYESVLQQSGDPLLETVGVTMNLFDQPAPDPIKEEDSREGPTAGGLAGAAIASAALVATVISLMLYAHKQRTAAKTLSENPVIQFDEFPNSPLAMSPVNVNNTSDTAPDGSSSPLRRSPTASFEAAAKSFMSNVTQSVSYRRMGPEHGDMASDTTESSEEANKGPHPYEDIVPPMIVIDNLDVEIDADKKSKKTSDIVPGMSLRADSELVAALNDTSTPFNASVLSNFISKRVDDKRPLTREYNEADIGYGQSFNVFSSDAEDENSHKADEEQDLEVGTILEHRGNDELSSKDTNAVSQVRNHWSNPARPPRVPGEGLLPQRDSPRSNSASPVPRDEQSSSVQAINNVPTLSLPPTSNPSTPPRPRDEKSSGDSLAGDRNATRVEPHSPGILSGLWAKISQRESSDDHSRGSSHRSRRQSSSHGSTSSHSPAASTRHARTSSHGSRGSRHVRTNSRASSASSGGWSHGDEGVILSFEAPSKGKLGLVIETRPLKGPMITKVKDYSPLLGQVFPGDCVVNVNGTRTDQMGANEVQILLSGGTNPWNGAVRLTVLRPDEASKEIGGGVSPSQGSEI